MWALLPNLEIVKTIKRLEIGPNCSVANLFNIELYWYYKQAIINTDFAIFGISWYLPDTDIWEVNTLYTKPFSVEHFH